ncbi:hypothetical protein ACFL04_01990 [Patescibacteria group bacterium]
MTTIKDRYDHSELTGMQFAFLKRFARILADENTRQRKHAEKIVNAEKKNIPSKLIVDDEIYELYLSSLEQTEAMYGYESDNFQQLLFRSFAITALVFIDDQLKLYCDHLKEKHVLAISVSDLRGYGARRSLNYVNKVTGKEILINANLKKHFKVAVELRNIFVHSEGMTTEKNHRLLNDYSKTYPKYLEIHDKHTFITEDYLKLLLGIHNKISDKIYRQLPEKYKRSK